MVRAKGLSEALPKVLDQTLRVASSPLAGLLRQTFFSGSSSFRVETPLAGPIFSEGTTFLQRKDGRGERIGFVSLKSFGPMLRISLLQPLRGFRRTFYQVLIRSLETFSGNFPFR